MALFNSGRVDDAHRDFSRVLELNPNHVMARYARAGCFNSEGEFNQAIQEYTLALQHDEKENAGGFRAEKRRMGLHEIAENLIRKTMGASARLRNAGLDMEPSPNAEPKSSLSVLEVATSRSLIPAQEFSVQTTQSVQPHSGSVPKTRPKKVVQVRVNLSEFASTTPQSKVDSWAPPAASQITRNEVISDVIPTTHLEAQSSSRSVIEGQPPLEQVPRVCAVRAVPKTVRRVTVAL
ncbi:Hypothetical protein PHPALM_17511 [Phytophthora palmivora]|uniref:Uncharacterized protein n=1 Tax=Phytophthora palmivora TaxID=4796 RepID=A0A2P4XM13_9STRA|nr:Hypothetical protein PHPALM_17511 [Phytophthora palmivora]